MDEALVTLVGKVGQMVDQRVFSSAYYQGSVNYYEGDHLLSDEDLTRFLKSASVLMELVSIYLMFQFVKAVVEMFI